MQGGRLSRRVPRLVEKYAKLSMEDRDRLEVIVDGMLGVEENTEKVLTTE